jgi:hypothetical protein
MTLDMLILDYVLMLVLNKPKLELTVSFATGLFYSSLSPQSGIRMVTMQEIISISVQCSVQCSVSSVTSCLKTKKLRIAIILDTNCTYICTGHA